MGQPIPRSNRAGESRKPPLTPIFQVKKMRLMAAQEQSCLSTKPSPCPPRQAEGCECPDAGPPWLPREVPSRRMQSPEPGTAASRCAQALTPCPCAPTAPLGHWDRAPSTRRAPPQRWLGHLTEMTNSCLPSAMKKYPQFKLGRGVGRGSSARLFADEGGEWGPKMSQQVRSRGWCEGGVRRRD